MYIYKRKIGMHNDRVFLLYRAIKLLFLRKKYLTLISFFTRLMKYCCLILLYFN